MFARLIFALVRFRARHGLAELAPESTLDPTSEPAHITIGPPRPNVDPDAEGEPPPPPFELAEAQAAAHAAAHAQAEAAKHRARRTGVRGETYAYWFLRSKGYVMVARNFMTPGVKGEIDIVGYDGPTLAFVEVKTRSASNDDPNGTKHLRPEDAVDDEKQRNVSRIAHRFRLARRVDTSSCRFDVVAIETRPGAPPIVRLHKGALDSSAA
jgi:putative endonuclease